MLKSDHQRPVRLIWYRYRYLVDHLTQKVCEVQHLRLKQQTYHNIHRVKLINEMPCATIWTLNEYSKIEAWNKFQLNKNLYRTDPDAGIPKPDWHSWLIIKLPMPFKNFFQGIQTFWHWLAAPRKPPFSCQSTCPWPIASHLIAINTYIQSFSALS